MIVSLLPAVGGPAIASVEAVVVITEVFKAANVGAPSRVALNAAAVPAAAVLVSVNVFP